MWDERYSHSEFAYGTEPNDFLVSKVDALPMGRVLCLGEGEGRNAVWLAKRGFDVTAVDASRVGLDKALKFAAAQAVELQVIHSDLADYAIEPGAWHAIVSIFCHIPLALRRKIHAQAALGLKPNGVFLLEGYTPAQLLLGTGGPPSVEMTMDLEALRDELAGVKLAHAVELQREIHEGVYHDGPGAVVQILGFRS